jgi:hypothetical protein
MTIPSAHQILKRGEKTRKLPRIKINGGRIRNSVQETPIMDIIRNNFSWLDQI